MTCTVEQRRRSLVADAAAQFEFGPLSARVLNVVSPLAEVLCPHTKRRATCEWTDYNHASNCPLNRSPHQVRSGAITWMLNKGMPIGEVSDKVNATEDVIREHYDKADPVDELLERRIDYSERLDIEMEDDNGNK